jgi:hypothetical protein
MIDNYSNATNQFNTTQQASPPAQPISSDLAMTGDALAKAHSLMMDIASRLRGPSPVPVADTKAPNGIIELARANRQRADTLVDYLVELLGAL